MLLAFDACVSALALRSHVKNKFVTAKKFSPWANFNVLTYKFLQGPPKQIKATNTRLPNTTLASLDELPIEARPQRGEGYQAVATPSLTPGPDQSPIMTWGELGATPVRLDEEGAGLAQPADSGPRFKMPERKTRDLAGHRYWTLSQLQASPTAYSQRPRRADCCSEDILSRIRLQFDFYDRSVPLCSPQLA